MLLHEMRYYRYRKAGKTLTVLMGVVAVMYGMYRLGGKHADSALDAALQEMDRAKAIAAAGTRACSVFQTFATAVVDGQVELLDEDSWCSELILTANKRKG